MDPVGVVLIVLGIWLGIAIIVALVIGRVVRRAEDDARLYGSLFAPPSTGEQRPTAAGTEAPGSDQTSGP